MKLENVTVIGTGLIGGSFALALKNKSIAANIIGVDINEDNLTTALKLGLIDEKLGLKEAVCKSDLIFVAVPVDATMNVMKEIMPLLNNKQVVADAGSTKEGLCNMVKHYALGNRFVATHPMWGTEHSGPEAAVENAFAGKACVICNRENSDNDAVLMMETILKKIGMHIIYMEAAAHDLHAAYVSHISHITSFALANTVLKKEKEDKTIFELASGGFESTVRLAKSNPEMWVPILKQNKANVLDVLNEHILQLQKFKTSLERNNDDDLLELIKGANTIKRIIK